jgi:A/G-specific adenine glycosylase
MTLLKHVKNKNLKPMSLKHFSHLISWSRSQYFQLPWRSQRTLYRTLVSEIMLQQTTVGTVLNHFEKFLTEYPSIFDLAASSEEQVCISWKGLGYYRRARSLRGIAIGIVEQFNGEIPTNIDDLRKLKGIGPYTANAIVAIGADLRGLALDANLERVLSRYYGVKVLKGPKLQQKLFSDFNAKKIMKEMDVLSPRDLNEALMDLGRVLCQARKASCLLCPLKEKCVAFKSEKPLSFPVEAKKDKKNDFFIKVVRIVVKEKNKILFYQKNTDEWLSGQWELPTFIFDTNDEALSQYPRIKIKKTFLDGVMIKTGITKYSIENYIVEMSLEDFQKISKKFNREYVFKISNSQLNLSTTSLKVLKKI